MKKSKNSLTTVDDGGIIAAMTKQEELMKTIAESCPLKPFGGRIVLIMDASEDKMLGSTSSGLIIVPKEVITPDPLGTIVGVGDKVTEKEFLTIGSKVYIAKYAGIDVKVGHVTFRVVKEEDILFKI